jgi:hypothetical protein
LAYPEVAPPDSETGDEQVANLRTGKQTYAFGI